MANPWYHENYPIFTQPANNRWLLDFRTAHGSLQNWRWLRTDSTPLATEHNLKCQFVNFIDDIYRTKFYMRRLNNGRYWQFFVRMSFSMIWWNTQNDAGVLQVARDIDPTDRAVEIPIDEIFSNRMREGRPNRSRFLRMLMAHVARTRQDIGTGLFNSAGQGEYGKLLYKLQSLTLQLIPSPQYYSTLAEVDFWRIDQPYFNDVLDCMDHTLVVEDSTMQNILNILLLPLPTGGRNTIDLATSRSKRRVFHKPPNSPDNLCVPMCLVLGVAKVDRQIYLRRHVPMWVLEAKKLIGIAREEAEEEFKPLLELSYIKESGIDVMNKDLMIVLENAVNTGVHILDMMCNTLYTPHIRCETPIRCAVDTRPGSINPGHMSLISKWNRFQFNGKHSCLKCNRKFSRATHLLYHTTNHSCMQCGRCKTFFKDINVKRNHFCPKLAKQIRPTHRFGENTSISCDLDEVVEAIELEEMEIDVTNLEQEDNASNLTILGIKQLPKRNNDLKHDYWIALDIESVQSGDAKLVDPGVHTPHVKRHLPCAIGLRFMDEDSVDHDVIPFIKNNSVIIQKAVEYEDRFTIDILEVTHSIIIWGPMCTLGLTLLLEEIQPYYTDMIRHIIEIKTSMRKDAQKAFQQQYREAVVPLIAHNGSRYDAPILLHEFILLLGQNAITSYCEPSNLVSRGTAYLAFRILGRNKIEDQEEQQILKASGQDYVGYQFLDSYRFLAHSLDNLGKTFGCNVEKGIFPYAWLQDHSQIGRVYELSSEDPTEETLLLLDKQDTPDVIRPPNRFDFSSGEGHHLVTDYRCLSYEEWKQFCEKRNYSYNVYEEIKHYLQLDIILLSEVWAKFRSKTLDRYSIDANTCISAPSLALRSFMSRLPHRNLATTITKELWQQIRESKMGGHTEPLARFATLDPMLAAKYNDIPMYMIMPWDANSLYPSLMASAWFPVGEPILHNASHEMEWLVDYFQDAENLEVPTLIPTDPSTPFGDCCAYTFEPPCTPFGFICVKVIPPNDILYAPLGERVKSEDDGYTRLEFNLLPKDKAIYFTEELKIAVKLYGYRVEEVYWWLEFGSSNDVFRDFVQEVYCARLAAKEEGDIITSEMEKIQMNSLFGKMLQDSDKFTNVNFVFNDQQVLQLVDNENELVMSFDTLRSGECARVVSKYIGPDKKSDIYIKTLAPVGVAILSWSRTFMAMFTKDLQVACPNARILYTDTDSLYVAFPTEESWNNSSQLQERYMGNKKLMHFKPEAKEKQIISFCAVTPKCYSYQMRKEEYSEEVEDHFKVKGVSQRYNENVLSFQAYLDQVFNPCAPPLMGSTFNISQRKPLQLYSSRSEKVVLTNRLTKRAWLPDHPIFTYPHGHKALIV